MITVFDSVEDLKSINPNAFWNGLLDENGSLLDVIDNKKQLTDGTTPTTASTTNLIDRKAVRRSQPNQRIGHSAFNVVNLHNDESTFVKVESKNGSPKPASSQTSQSANNNAGNCGDASTMVKKESVGVEVVETSVVPNNTMEVQIKHEPIDETHIPNLEEQSLQVRQQIVPVIKTEIGNNVPVVSNPPIQRPITLQQTAQLHQPSHQQTFATNDQTLILSSRPIRRLNGPSDGKAGNLLMQISLVV